MPPTALISSLNTVRRRVRTLTVLYGIGIVLAAIIGALLATVLLDYLFNLPPIPRIMVMVLAMALIARELVRWIVRPARAKLGLSDIAGRLERAFPAFDDRLRSTIEFASGNIPGSEAMKNRVMTEAAELAGHLDLNSAIQTKPLWQSFAAGGGAILLLVLLTAAIGPDYFHAALSRLLTPFDSTPWPKRVQIQLVDDIPQRIAVGQRVDLRVRLAKGDRPWREVRVFSQYGNGPVEQQVMTRGADGLYSAALDTHIDSPDVKVWIQAGDDSTDPRTISIVPRLAVTSVDLTVTPPPYAQQPATLLHLDAAPATVTYGSTLTVKLTFNKSLDVSHPVTLDPAQGRTAPANVTWDSPTSTSIVGHWMALQNSTFHASAVDVDGLSNSDTVDYQVIVRPDELPSIQVTRPARNEECTPQAIIPLRAIAEDDFGITSVKLEVTLLGDKPRPFPSINLFENGKPADGVTWARLDSAGDTRRWQIDFPWTLASLDPATPLKPGDVLEYHLTAQDNFDLDGQRHNPVSSAKYRITIMSQEEFTSLMNDLLSQVRQQIVDVRNTERGLKDQTVDLRQETQSQPQFSNADRRQADQLIARQTTAASQANQASNKLQQLLDRMDENRSTATDLKDVATAVRDDLNQVAEHPMKDAAGQLDDAKNQKSNPNDSPQDRQQKTDARNNALDSAQNNQQAAADRLDQMIARMGQVGGLPEAIQKLQDILNQQRDITNKSNDVGLRNLGKRPDQMDPQDQKAQQDNANAQKALADKTQKTIEQMDTASQRLAKSDPSASSAMKQAAQTGEQQNVVSEMQNSAQQQSQNQQSSAQGSQAKVEVGLQTMIRQLQEAQNRRLEELARQLADMQQQIQALIRQQGGLNYDNLALQGGDVLKKSDAKLVASLLEDAQWTADAIPPIPDSGMQTRLQEQTERNTRSISKAAEALPEGPEIAASLSRAADRMSRAITFLRDDQTAQAQRLTSAYDPAQIQALAALHKALETADKQAQKNEDQRNQQKKDSIRAAYEKILADQKKIDADTKSIDASPRTADGQLGHRQAIQLAQLPPQQDDLVTRTTKLGDDLASLGSIVYTWTNADIVDSMKGVKTDLAKPQTGMVTQAEQLRIEEQLQAMIDSLKIKPRQSQFSQRQQQQGGGGANGGSGSQPLPPEAELQLLKRLQQAINKATQTIAGQGNPQEPALVALGGRQGELRNLLDQLLQKASNGKVKLGPEPGPDEKVPEETTNANPDDADLQHALLNDDGQPNGGQESKDISLIGKRMSRSHTRLAADHDPGQVTQEIQKRILKDMDDLIQMAQAQQSQAQPQSGQQQTGQQQQQQARNQNPNNSSQPNNSNNQNQNQNQQNNTATRDPATSARGHDTDTTGTPTADITQTLKEWGALSPRKRDAVTEAASEKPIERFKNFIDEYYRALGERAAESH